MVSPHWHHFFPLSQEPLKREALPLSLELFCVYKMIRRRFTTATLLTVLLCYVPVESRVPTITLVGNSVVVAKAKSWEGRHYRHGQSFQCANFVGHIITESGGSTPQNFALARNWLSWGKSIPMLAMRPGDVVVTWRGSKHGTSGHILIYIGNGECIHRPTRSRAVCRTKLSYYQSKILGVRRSTVFLNGYPRGK